MIPVAVLMVYYLIKGEVSPIFELWFLIPFLLLWLGTLGMGFGILVSGMTTKYRDLTVLVSFGMSLLMYGTPVVYPLSTVPANLYKLALFNPVTMPVELFRYALYGTGTICYWSIALSVAVSIVVFLLGLILFNKLERIFIDTV